MREERERNAHLPGRDRESLEHAREIREDGGAPSRLGAGGGLLACET